LGVNEAAVQETQDRATDLLKPSPHHPSNKAMPKGKTMKSSANDQVEGKVYQIKGKVREMAGEISGKPDLKAESSSEKLEGKAQEKIGDIEKVFGK
jgi:uncharacterized protein YjbJ (UPF0337 family)